MKHLIAFLNRNPFLDTLSRLTFAGLGASVKRGREQQTPNRRCSQGVSNWKLRFVKAGGIFFCVKANAKFNHLWLFQFFADFTAICCAYFLTYFFRFHSEFGERFFTFINRTIGIRDAGEIAGPFDEFYVISAPRIIIILTIVICFIYALLNLYPGRRFIVKRPVAWNIILANGIALVIFYAYFYLQRNVFHPRSYFVTLLFVNVLLTIIFRFGINLFFHFLRMCYQVDIQKTIIIGSAKELDYIKRLIDLQHPHGLKVVRSILVDKAESFEQSIQDTLNMVSKLKADVMIVARNDFSMNEIMRFMEIADWLGVSIKVLSDKMTVLNVQAKMPTDYIHGVPLVHFNHQRKSRLRCLISDFLSRASAFLLLLLFAPLMLVIAILVKLTSAGPVMFIQERVGVNRKPFKMYKFRTMYDRAEEAQAQLEEFNETEGLFKIKNDPRVTPVGRLLRRFSLDELPQLINAVKGDMRIVGPRPLPKRDFENYYEEWHYGRHEGLPGLTCLWQISGRSDIDFHNMCILDVYYLRNRNWLLDLRIFIRTIWVVLFGRGAY